MRWKCYIFFPTSFKWCLSMFMEEIVFFFLTYRLAVFIFMTIIKKNLNIKLIFPSTVCNKRIYLRSILFHGFCRQLMKFFPVQLCSSTIIFLLNILCITTMLLKECILFIKNSFSYNPLSWKKERLTALALPPTCMALNK